MKGLEELDWKIFTPGGGMSSAENQNILES